MKPYSEAIEERMKSERKEESVSIDSKQHADRHAARMKRAYGIVKPNGIEIPRGEDFPEVSDEKHNEEMRKLREIKKNKEKSDAPRRTLTDRDREEIIPRTTRGPRSGKTADDWSHDGS